MGSRFLKSFLIAFLLTLPTLGGVGWGVARLALALAPPREQVNTTYFTFDLAPGWSCEFDGNEYVCTTGRAPHPAIAIIALKKRSAQDWLTEYESYLREPLPFTMKNGETKTSEVRFVRRTMLGDKQWVHGLHVGSELPNYLTYYLATTTPALGILVTMSVLKDSVDKYVGQLDDMMSSLTVYQP